MSVEWSAISATPVSHPLLSRLREHCGRGGGKTVRARGQGDLSENYLLNTGRITVLTAALVTYRGLNRMKPVNISP